MGKRSRGVQQRKEPPAYENDPQFVAGFDLLGRTGARSVQIRYNDDEKPVVWFVVAIYEHHRKFDVGAAATPQRAMLRLLEELIDGAECRHCRKPTVFDPDFDGQLEDIAKVFGMDSCIYAFDPELAKYRRGCEGET